MKLTDQRSRVLCFSRTSLLAASLLLFVGVSAFAVGSVASSGTFTMTSPDGVAVSAGSKAAVCPLGAANYVRWQNAFYGPVYGIVWDFNGVSLVNINGTDNCRFVMFETGYVNPQELYQGIAVGAASCPANSTGSPASCQCAAYFQPNSAGTACIAILARDRNHDKSDGGTCSAKRPGFGHPIYSLTGSKTLSEQLLGAGIGGQPLTANYDTRRKVPSNDPTRIFSALPAASFGDPWSSSLHKSLVFQTDDANTVQAIQASRGASAWVSFARDSSGNYRPDADVNDRLLAVSGGWRYFDGTTRAQENYDSTGKLTSAVYANNLLV